MTEDLPVITLRPHHLLCIRHYVGMGYDAAFTKQMDAITKKLKDNPDIPVRLTFSMDDICKACPHKVADDICETQEKVLSIDRKTIDAFQLTEGVFVYSDLQRHISEKLSLPLHASICEDCEWKCIKT